MIKIIKDNEVINYIDENSIIITSSNFEIYYKKKYMGMNCKVYTFKNFILNNYNGFLSLLNENEEFLYMYRAYLKCKDKLKRYNDIDDLSFVKDLLSTYNSFSEYEFCDNYKINDLKVIYDMYEKLLIDNRVLNNKLLFENVIENNNFNKKYIFLNITKLNNYELDLIKNMNLNGSVFLTINEYDECLISKLKSIDSSLDISVKSNNKVLDYYALNDIEEELFFVLNDINSKVINDKCKYSDFLIVAKDKELYEPYFKYIFDIPYTKKEYNGILIKRFIKIFKNIINGDFSCNNFMNLLKLNLFDIDLSLIDKLDNYIYEWNLEDVSFYIPFAKGNDTSLNESLNDIRNSILISLKYFIENIINEKNIRIIEKEFWTYLSLNKLDEKLYLYDPVGYTRLVSLSENISNCFNLNVGIVKYFEVLNFLYNKSFSESNYIDEVLICDINNLYLYDKKYVYILNTNSKLYPKSFSLPNLLTMSDLKRNSLINKIKEFSSYDKAMFDMIVNFSNVIITYHKLSLDLSLNEVSTYLNGKVLDSSKELYTKKIIYNNYANFLSDNKVFKINIDDSLVNKINISNDHDLNFKIKKESALKLYTNNINCSPSSIESYCKCKFYHFCQYGLRLKVKEKRLFDNREIGTIIHYILENILKNDIDKISIDNLNDLASYYAFKYLNDNKKVVDNVSKYIVLKLSYNASLVIKNIIEENEVSSFRPLYTEFRIDKDSIIKPISVNFDSGSITVTGVLDRIDSCCDDNNFYYRIIDYKAGGKKLRLDDVLLGLNLQMLLYVLAIKESIKNITDKKPVISAVFYYPAIIKDEKVSRSLDENLLNESIKKRLLMQGIVNRDKDSLKMLGGENLKSYIDVYSRGKINDEKTYSNDELNLIFDNIKTTLVNIGNDILSGDIKVNPVKGRVDACLFCKFNSICSFDFENDKARYLKNYKNSEVLKMLGGEDSE